MENIILRKAKDKKHKYIATIDAKDVKFGAYGYSDYILSGGDKLKKKAYIARHSQMGEDWKKSGIKTKGFWAKWLLWNKPTIEDSIKDIEKRFNIRIIFSS